MADKELEFNRGDKVSDRYVIEELIGRGGMGVVYRAQDSLLGERVALKFMRPRLVGTQRGHLLFIKEAQVARRLRHENIVAVHDVATTTEGILYLSMEYIQGYPLRTVLRSRRVEGRLIGVPLVVRLLAQVLSALAYAHKFVVHRDIKPENVLLLPGERVKVLDFGLAKAVDEDYEAANATSGDERKDGEAGGGTARPARVIGTTGYASPEQEARREDVDLRADLYTVGLLFREMLTLRTPIEEQVAIESVRSDVSPSLLSVLNRALQREREDRWQTAGEFRRALLQSFDESYRPVAVVARPAPGTEAVVASTEGMVYLEGGNFLMGSQATSAEAPQHEAHVDPFYIDRHPVTVEQYRAFLEASGRPAPPFWSRYEYSGAKQPVVGVTWEEAAAYAAWAGKRLPTEAQWEFAARGKENRRYPWGVQEPDATRCNYGDFLNMPSIVTMHEEGATPEGVLDLAGNVYEWTADWFEPYAANMRGARGEAKEAAAPKDPRRTVRGGSWQAPPSELRCTFRKGLFPETRLATVGFRCVVGARASSAHAINAGAQGAHALSGEANASAAEASTSGAGSSPPEKDTEGGLT